MYEHYRLPNKANVYLVPFDSTNSVTGLIMFPVGSRYEPEKLNGVSHYIEHLMFKGTAKRKSTLLLTREIDRLGAEYNAFTGKETTGYYIKADARYSETLVDILSDMLFNSLFDAKEMEREKGVVVEELRMYEDNPLMNIDTILEKALYEGCPLSWDIGGTPRHVKSYERQDVLAFRDRYYDPSAMTIVFAGSIRPEMKRHIAQYFGSRASARRVSGVYKPGRFGPAEKSRRLVVQHKKNDQAQMMLGFPAFAHRDKVSPVMAVLNTILGGSMSSRLFIQIRERRGLAYVVKSGVQPFRDIGHFYVQAGLEPKNINRAIVCIKEELEKMAARPVTKRTSHIRIILANE